MVLLVVKGLTLSERVTEDWKWADFKYLCEKFIVLLH